MLYLVHSSWTENKATLREACPMEENRTVRFIPCDDVAERERTFQVIATPGRVSLVAPPGEVAHLHPRQYELLRRALLEVLPTAWKESPS